MPDINDAHRGPHQPPPPLTTDGLIDTLVAALHGGLPTADVRLTADYSTLTHTPRGAANPAFRAEVEAVAATVVAHITADGRRALALDVHFSGVPISGSVRCAVTVSGGRIDLRTLADALADHGAATLGRPSEHRVTFALYPPHAAD